MRHIYNFCKIYSKRKLAQKIVLFLFFLKNIISTESIEKQKQVFNVNSISHIKENAHYNEDCLTPVIRRVKKRKKNQNKAYSTKINERKVNCRNSCESGKNDCDLIKENVECIFTFNNAEVDVDTDGINEINVYRKEESFHEQVLPDLNELIMNEGNNVDFKCTPLESENLTELNLLDDLPVLEDRINMIENSRNLEDYDWINTNTFSEHCVTSTENNNSKFHKDIEYFKAMLSNDSPMWEKPLEEYYPEGLNTRLDDILEIITDDNKLTHNNESFTEREFTKEEEEKKNTFSDNVFQEILEEIPNSICLDTSQEILQEISKNNCIEIPEEILQDSSYSISETDVQKESKEGLQEHKEYTSPPITSNTFNSIVDTSILGNVSTSTSVLSTSEVQKNTIQSAISIQPVIPIQELYQYPISVSTVNGIVNGPCYFPTTVATVMCCPKLNIITPNSQIYNIPPDIIINYKKPVYIPGCYTLEDVINDYKKNLLKYYYKEEPKTMGFMLRLNDLMGIINQRQHKIKLNELRESKDIIKQMYYFILAHISNENPLEKDYTFFEFIESPYFMCVFTSFVALLTNNSFKKELYHLKRKGQRREEKVKYLKLEKSDGRFLWYQLFNVYNTLILDGGNIQANMVGGILRDILYEPIEGESFNLQEFSKYRDKFILALGEVKCYFYKLYDHIIVSKKKKCISSSEVELINEYIKSKIKYMFSIIENVHTYLKREIQNIYENEQIFFYKLYEKLVTRVTKSFLVHSESIVELSVLIYSFKKVTLILEKYLVVFKLIPLTKEIHNTKKSKEASKRLMQCIMLYCEFYLFKMIILRIQSHLENIALNFNTNYLNQSRLNKQIYLVRACNSCSEVLCLLNFFSNIVNLIQTYEKHARYIVHIQKLYEQINEKIDKLKNIFHKIKKSNSNIQNEDDYAQEICVELFKLYDEVFKRV